MQLDQSLFDKAMISDVSRKDELYSAIKVCAYFGSVIALATAFLVFEENTAIAGLCVVMLGVAYMHGVELQHEALHGNLFKSPAMNRLVGRLTGLPMLVSYTHYRSYHFHHHKCVGTSRDEELFNYTTRSLTNPISVFVRVWNLMRIPSFLVTFLGMLQGDYPDKIAPSERRALLAEYTVMAVLLGVALISPFYWDSTLLWLWVIPWLVVAEPLHFFAEIPEHIGCDRQTRSTLKNTRSYRTNPIWAYLINYNNFHIEHHLFPAVPAHRLSTIHDRVSAVGGHCSKGYWSSLAEIYATVRGRGEG